MQLQGNEAIVLPLDGELDPNTFRKVNTLDQAKQTAIELTKKESRPFGVFVPQMKTITGKTSSGQPQIVHVTPEGSGWKYPTEEFASGSTAGRN